MRAKYFIKKRDSLKWILMICVLTTSFVANSQELVVKTNLLYDATATINLGVEVGIAPKWTLDLSGNYNPWKLSDNKKVKHWMLQPEVRYWTCQKFNGWFVGAHVHTGGYNVNATNWLIDLGKYLSSFPNEKLGDYRNEGWFAGGGIAVGYHWLIVKRWSMEFSTGFGYTYFDNSKYEQNECNTLIGTNSKHFWGPTKASISVVFTIL